MVQRQAATQKDHEQREAVLSALYCELRQHLVAQVTEDVAEEIHFDLTLPLSQQEDVCGELIKLIN